MIPLHESITQLLTRAIDLMDEQECIEVPLPDQPLLRFERSDAIRLEAGSGYLFTIGQLSSIAPPVYDMMFTVVVIDQWDLRTSTGPVAIFPVSLHDTINSVTIIGAILSDGVSQVDEPKQKLLAMLIGLWLIELEAIGYF